MKKNIKENKILFCILLAAIFIIAIRITGVVFRGLKMEKTAFTSFLVEAIFAIVAYILLRFAGKQKILGKKASGLANGLIAGGFVLVLAGMSIIKFFLNEENIRNIISNKDVIFFTLEMILVGVAEEFVFRGAIQNTFYDYFGKDTRNGIYKSIICSGVIFGIVHIFNILGGVSIKGAIVQAINAVVIGCYFGAIYYRSDNIWSTVFLHAMMDFSALMEAELLGKGSEIEIVSAYGTTNMTEVIWVVIVYLGLTAFILRKSKVKLPEK